ncbi:unnamed protein product [Effrenium voratum]|uniref:Sulfotransferase n=1 Tax=Effrenium voratum TaxID=2562239 RepID=A0AA36I3M0_9DINO|nr:unnamed protein product [Effrenium voratum]CAJ1414172.1 unnamed protein product [Effrenium voratum]
MARLVGFLLGGCASNAPDMVACPTEYEANAAMWYSMSGATSIFAPPGHRPAWYWQEVMKRRGLSGTVEDLGYADLWLDQLFGEAQSQLLGCWVHGGRYWEATLQLRAMARKVPASNVSAFLRYLSRLVFKGTKLEIEGVPEVLRTSLCAPISCQEAMLAEVIYPKFIATRLLKRASGFLEPQELAQLLEIKEMMDWSSIQLDFAVAGVDSCGTSSLHRNLDKHVEIAFSTSDEDFFFSNQVVHRLLPLKQQVDAYNAQLEAVREAKWRSTGHRPTLLGLCNPTLFSYGLPRRALASMPNLKTVVVLCDPLNRLEKEFVMYRYCHEDLAQAMQRGLASRDHHAASHPRNCFPSASALLSERWGALRDFWASREVAQHLQTMLTLFSGRGMVLHQERLSSRETFTALVQFIGAQYGFSKEATFPRHNSVGGHRSDLCFNMTLVQSLQSLLEPEYRMQEYMFSKAEEPLPRLLGSRVTRCHQLSAAHCPFREACEQSL